MSTRYSGQTNSKSVNARIAETEGRVPPTAMAAELRRRGLFAGVTAADIKAAVTTLEWHHVGSYAARIDYYSLEQVFADRRRLRAVISARRAAPSETGVRIEGCSAEWLEWSGSRRYPRAVERRAENIAVTLKGRWAVLHLNGAALRKNLSTRGFTVRGPDGRML